jgi:hypothetical protein
MRIRMLRLFTVAASVAVLFGCANSGMMASSSPIKDVEGKQVHLQQNVWFDADGEHQTVNYKYRAQMLAVNTEVTIKSTSGSTITFAAADSDQTYTLIHVPEYSGTDLQGVYDRYFAPRALDLTGQFTAAERAAIDNGEIVAGMDKDAVLVSRGFPPAHETASTDSDAWRYWKAKHDTRVIFFQDGEVARIKD